jgi:hypothetical protein
VENFCRGYHRDLQQALLTFLHIVDDVVFAFRRADGGATETEERPVGQPPQGVDQVRASEAPDSGD